MESKRQLMQLYVKQCDILKTFHEFTNKDQAIEAKRQELYNMKKNTDDLSAEVEVMVNARRDTIRRLTKEISEGSTLFSKYYRAVTQSDEPAETKLNSEIPSEVQVNVPSSSAPIEKPKEELMLDPGADYKNVFKCVVLGSGEVGKTQFIRAFLGEPYNNDYVSTEEVKTYEKIISVYTGETTRNVKVMINEMPGDREFAVVRKDIYAEFKPDFAVIVGSALCQGTFRSSVQYFRDEIRSVMPNIPVQLVINKSDAVDEIYEGSCDEDFFQVSAKAGFCVDEVFISLFDSIWNPKPKAPDTIVDDMTFKCYGPQSDRFLENLKLANGKFSDNGTDIEFTFEGHVGATPAKYIVNFVRNGQQETNDIDGVMVFYDYTAMHPNEALTNTVEVVRKTFSGPIAFVATNTDALPIETAKKMVEEWFQKKHIYMNKKITADADFQEDAEYERVKPEFVDQPIARLSMENDKVSELKSANDLCFRLNIKMDHGILTVVHDFIQALRPRDNPIAFMI